MKRLTQAEVTYIAQACREAARRDEDIRSTLARFDSISHDAQLVDHFQQRANTGRELADLFDRDQVVHVDVSDDE